MRLTRYSLHGSILLAALVAFLATASDATAQPGAGSMLYDLVPPDQSGIDFGNYVTETDQFNIQVFVYAYNGAGVAVGDVNADGLPDIFFGSSQVPMRLYLNRGGLKFEDATARAGIVPVRPNVVGDTANVAFGVAMVDIDGDADLDIYVCKQFTSNLLYINDGTGVFTERAKEFGLDFAARSMQPAFFDYDRDGDLDLYIAVNGDGKNSFSIFGFTDHLFRNNGNNTFTDVSIEAGIGDRGFAQSVAIGDLNNDSWPDIYVANDFEGRDMVYFNNGNGTFRNVSDSVIKHSSTASMGSDIADYNNDGFADVITLDMLPESHKRRMSHIGVTSIYTPTFDSTQLNRNVLQLNRGNGTFADIGQIAGISETDWSWAPLFEDVDNDGDKDLFVTNGYKRDVSNQDIAFSMMRTSMDPVAMFKIIPTTRLQPYLFRNNGDLTFTKMNDQWGITQVVNSNGAAFVDLDLDGDMEIVVNTMDSTAFLYKSNAIESKLGNYLRIRCKGRAPNTEGIGAKIEIRSNGNYQMREIYKNRGYLSSVEAVAHFGLGPATSVDEVAVTWPDGTRQKLTDVKCGQVLVLDQADASKPEAEPVVEKKHLFRSIPSDRSLAYIHRENTGFDDFERERLLPRRFSKDGPGTAVGDVNGDGMEDVFIGGAKFASGAIYLQDREGRFTPTPQPDLAKDAACEDMGALLFDADGDRDLDLYIVSGGNETIADAPELQDRLYINDGKGNFTKNTAALPVMITSGSCVVGADYDGDGDIDLFVGGRSVPGRFPEIPRSYLLKNTRGTFTDVTESAAPGLARVGMLNAALWTDFDNDNDPDMIVAGDWMTPRFFRNDKGKLTDVTAKSGVDSNNGWWNSIAAGDFDSDGDMDYVLGNLGLNTNSRHRPSREFPVRLYANDFDENGSVDLVVSYYYKGIEYPMRDRMTMASQMPALIRRKFPTFNLYASTPLSDFFPKGMLQASVKFEAYNFASSYLENMGNGTFRISRLPVMAQVSPTFGMSVEDFDADGNLDLLLVGNFYNADGEVVRYDAGNGLYLRGDGKGGLTPMPVSESGFSATNDARGLTSVRNAAKNSLYAVVINNNAPAQVYEREYTAGEGKLVDFEGEGEFTHMLMKLKDGRTRRYECSFGSGYLSQCSGTILVPPSAVSATLYRGAKKLKTVELAAGK